MWSNIDALAIWPKKPVLIVGHCHCKPDLNHFRLGLHLHDEEESQLLIVTSSLFSKSGVQPRENPR